MGEKGAHSTFAWWYVQKWVVIVHHTREAGPDKLGKQYIITGLFDSLDRRTWSWVQRIELLHYHCGLDDIRYSDTSGMATDTVLDKECPEQNRVIIILASTLPPSNHQNFLRHHTVRKSCWERQSPVDRSIGYNHRRLFFLYSCYYYNLNPHHYFNVIHWIATNQTRLRRCRQDDGRVPPLLPDCHLDLIKA